MVITIEGIKKDIPSCYEQLTTRQYELLIPELAKDIVDRDHFKMFQVLANTSFQEFHATSENEVTIWNAIKWLYEQHFEFGEMPKVLRIVECDKDRIVRIPKDVTKLSIGQNVRLKQIIAESKYLEENLSAAVAVYLQPLFDEAKFEDDRAMEFKETIEQMPVYLIRPIGFFLLTHASGSGGRQVSLWRRTLNNLGQSLSAMSQLWQRSQGYNLSRT